MNNQSTQATGGASDRMVKGPPAWRPVAAWAAVLLLHWCTWLLAYWPGILGEDSLSVMLEVDGRDGHASGKPLAWVMFVRALYGTTGHIEWVALAQVVLLTLMLARMLGWVWAQGLRIMSVLLGVFFALAPHMGFFAVTVYPDALFAVATVALLFECWLVARNKHVDGVNLLMLAVVLPLALFLRSNGLASALSLAMAALFLGWGDRFKLLALLAFWLSLHAWGQAAYPTRPQQALFPLVVHETANFLMPRPTGLWANRQVVRPSTVTALSTVTDVATIQRYYDRDYWDPLVFHPDGPRLGRLADAQREVLVRDFWEHNLWVNLPAFVSSRVNVFLSASLAHGGFPDVAYSRLVLPQTRAVSQFRLPVSPALAPALSGALQVSFDWRYLLWTPFVGLGLCWLVIRQGLRQKRRLHWVVTLPLVMQVGGIFVFSTAAEYRYLLPIFLAPICLLPMWWLGRRS